MLKIDVDNNCIYSGNNWAYHIKSILDNCGLSYIWINQFNMPIDVESVKRRIIDIYKQEWYTSINNSNRLETYALFKHSFVFETYLDCIKENKYSIALTRFRTSSHDLAIETGRYENKERNERLCTNCNMNMIETEYHFLMICPKHRDLRLKYFKPYYCSWPNTHKFVNLLSTNSTRMINNLAKFIFYANRNRN